MANFCANCGAQMDDNMLFCEMCGTKVQDAIISHKMEYGKKENDIEIQGTQKRSRVHKKRKKKAHFGKIQTWFLFIILFLLIGCRVLDYYEIPALEINNSNQEIAETANIPHGDFDEILAQGDGYYIVIKHVETYETSHDEYGVIDNNSEWLTPLSSNNYISQAVKETMHDGYNVVYSPAEFVYLGEKMFAVKTSCALIGRDTLNHWATSETHGDSSVLDVENQTFFRTRGYVITKFTDGYMFVKSLSTVKRYSRFGNSKTLDTSSSKNEMYLGEPSMGLIYANQRFYDMKTCAIKIDLTKYDVSKDPFDSHSIRSVNNDGNIKFGQDGLCTFKFYNPGRKLYEVKIDMEGNFVSEPQLVQ